MSRLSRRCIPHSPLCVSVCVPPDPTRPAQHRQLCPVLTEAPCYSAYSVFEAVVTVHSRIQDVAAAPALCSSQLTRTRTRTRTRVGFISKAKWFRNRKPQTRSVFSRGAVICETQLGLPNSAEENKVI